MEIDELREFSSSPDPQLRRKAAREGERSHDLRTVSILAPLARDDEDPGVRFVALKALKVFLSRLERAQRELATVPDLVHSRILTTAEPPSKPPVSKLDAKDAAERRQAALNMGEKGDPLAIPKLVAAMAREPEGWVRAEQAWALGVLGTGEGVTEGLIRLLRDPVSRVRANAIEALHRLNCDDYQELALPLLEDQDRRVRANTALALSTSHWRAAHECLERLAVSPDRLDRHAALFSLQRLPEKPRRSILERMQDDPDPDIRDRVRSMLSAE